MFIRSANQREACWLQCSLPLQCLSSSLGLKTTHIKDLLICFVTSADGVCSLFVFFTSPWNSPLCSNLHRANAVQPPFNITLLEIASSKSEKVVKNLRNDCTSEEKVKFLRQVLVDF